MLTVDNLIDELGIPMKDLPKRLGVTARTLFNVRRGFSCRCHPTTVKKMAKGFGVTTEVVREALEGSRHAAQGKIVTDAVQSLG